MKTTETMVLFWGSDCPFSNWYPAPFTWRGLSFANTEQFMMYHKSLLMNDEETAKELLSTTDPRKAKGLGRKVKNYDEAEWEKSRLSVMITGCAAKFSQNPKLKELLLGTGNKVLVEASPFDKVWGIGLDQGDPRALDPKQWRGRNLLGVSLIAVREDLSYDD